MTIKPFFRLNSAKSMKLTMYAFTICFPFISGGGYQSRNIRINLLNIKTTFLYIAAHPTFVYLLGDFRQQEGTAVGHTLWRWN
jgi:hypothetical protein